MWPLIAWLLACSQPPGEDTAGPHPQDTGVMPTVTTLEPVLAPEDVVPQIEAILAEELLLPIEVHTWSMQLFDDLEGGTGTCPSRAVSETEPGHWVSFWSGRCTGETYAITGNWLADVNRLDTETRQRLMAVEVWSLRGTTVDGGGEVSASGQSEIVWSQEAGLVRFNLQVLGGFLDPAGSPAFQAGILPAASFDGTWSDDQGYVGTLVGSVGRDDSGLRFDDLTFTEGCASPTGVLGVRDPSSGWWEIELADCSGCGPLRFGDETVGEACAGTSLKSTIDERFRAQVETPG